MSTAATLPECQSAASALRAPCCISCQSETHAREAGGVVARAARGHDAAAPSLINAQSTALWLAA
eukprot:15450425-Alexandrium_andersonii.AAC.1